MSSTFAAFAFADLWLQIHNFQALMLQFGTDANRLVFPLPHRKEMRVFCDTVNMETLIALKCELLE